MLTRNEVLSVFLVHDLDNPITFKTIYDLLTKIDAAAAMGEQAKES